MSGRHPGTDTYTSVYCNAARDRDRCSNFHAQTNVHTAPHSNAKCCSDTEI